MRCYTWEKGEGEKGEAKESLTALERKTEMQSMRLFSKKKKTDERELILEWKMEQEQRLGSMKAIEQSLKAESLEEMKQSYKQVNTIKGIKERQRNFKVRFLSLKEHKNLYVEL